jgi:hypothetical protein
LSTSRQPRLRLVRPHDPQAERAGSDWELFEVYKSAKRTQWSAERAGLSDLARDARGWAVIALSHLRALRRRP